MKTFFALGAGLTLSAVVGCGAKDGGDLFSDSKSKGQSVVVYDTQFSTDKMQNKRVNRSIDELASVAGKYIIRTTYRIKDVKGLTYRKALETKSCSGGGHPGSCKELKVLSVYVDAVPVLVNKKLIALESGETISEASAQLEFKLSAETPIKDDLVGQKGKLPPLPTTLSFSNSNESSKQNNLLVLRLGKYHLISSANGSQQNRIGLLGNLNRWSAKVPNIKYDDATSTIAAASKVIFNSESVSDWVELHDERPAADDTLSNEKGGAIFFNDSKSEISSENE